MRRRASRLERCVGQLPCLCVDVALWFWRWPRMRQRPNAPPNVSRLASFPRLLRLLRLVRTRATAGRFRRKLLRNSGADALRTGARDIAARRRLSPSPAQRWPVRKVVKVYVALARVLLRSPQQLQSWKNETPRLLDVFANIYRLSYFAFLEFICPIVAFGVNYLGTSRENADWRRRDCAQIEFFAFRQRCGSPCCRK